MQLLLFTALSAVDGTLGVQADNRSSSPGMLDGMAADLRVSPTARASLQMGTAVRLSSAAWDRHWEDDWVRARSLGTLRDGMLPVAADVWTAEFLMGFRALDGPASVDLQLGWSVRAQATAYLAKDETGFTIRTGDSMGQVELQPLNPVVGLATGIPLSPAVGLEVGLQQVFPIQDPVLAANPGFTVVRVGVRVGSSGGPAAKGADDGPPGIRRLGVAEADAVFERVDAIERELAALERALAEAEASLRRVAQLHGLAPADFLAEVRGGRIDLGLTVKLQGRRPQLAVRPGLDGELGEAAEAVQAVGAAAGEIAESVPQLVKEVEGLLVAATKRVEAFESTSCPRSTGATSPPSGWTATGCPPALEFWSPGRAFPERGADSAAGAGRPS